MVIYGDANRKYSETLSRLGKMYVGYDFGEIFGFRFDESLTGLAADGNVRLSPREKETFWAVWLMSSDSGINLI